jgi:hypothetical protein
MIAQMMLLPLLLVAFAAYASAAISEVRPHSNRPGRFLSLPVPQKCANSEFRHISFRYAYLLFFKANSLDGD